MERVAGISAISAPRCDGACWTCSAVSGYAATSTDAGTSGGHGGALLRSRASRSGPLNQSMVNRALPNICLEGAPSPLFWLYV